MKLGNLLEAIFGGNNAAKAAVERRAPLGKPVDAEPIERQLRRDFGGRVSFISYHEPEAGFDPQRVFVHKTLDRPRSWGQAAMLRYQLDGGRTALAFTLDIPTFDSGDREYDSWHTLYLLPGRQAGTVDGYYCTGGYKLAHAVYCRELRSVSARIWTLLIEQGVLGGGKARVRWHTPGETFLAEMPSGGQSLWMQALDKPGCVAVTGTNEVEGSIVIPRSVDSLLVTEIDGSAFSGSKELQSVQLPGSITRIGDYAFSGCSALTEVTLAEGVQEIGYHAFSGCSALARIRLPKSLKTIAEGAFDGCSSLKTVFLPAGMQGVGIGSGFFPGGFLPQGASFTGCESLARIMVAQGSAKFKEKDGVLFSKDGAKLLQYPAGKTDESYTVPPVKEVAREAFSGCKRLKRLCFASGAWQLAPMTFQNCTGLEEIAFPDTLEKMSERVFEGCSALRRISIPAGMSGINAAAFEDCANLETIELSADSEQYRLQDGILFNKAGTELILYPRAAKAECYHIPPGVTSIGDGAFAGCTSLKKIVLPPWLQKVGKGAFSHCCGLQEIQFLPGTGGINIEEEAFSGCTALQELTLPEGMEGVKKAAFAGCEQLHRINLPASMKRLGNYAFSGCKALHKIDLPEKLAAIGFMTFSGCGLTEMIFPKSIRYIDNLAFENCSIFKFVYRGGQDDWIEKVDLEDDAFAQSGAWGVDFLE